MGTFDKDDLTPEILAQRLKDLVPEDGEAWGGLVKKIDLLQRAIDALPEEFYVKDTDHRFLALNQKVADVHGLEKESMLGKSDFDLYPPEQARRFKWEETKVMASGVPLHTVPCAHFMEDGFQRWFRVSKYPLVDEDGQIVGLFGISRHVTTQKQTETMLRAQSEILEMVATNRSLTNIFERITKLNDEQISRVVSSVMLLDKSGKRFEKVISTYLPSEFTNKLIGVEVGKSQGSCGAACYLKETVITEDIEADPRWDQYRDLARKFGFRSCWSSPILRSDGSVAGSFAIYSKSVRSPTKIEAELFDMGTWLASIAIESHTAAEAVRLAAQTDPLTGVLNRGTFNTLLQKKLSKAKRNNVRFAVVFIDLDDFKLVNDQHGHQVGDEYLKVVSERMRQALNGDGEIARVGGDEFMLMLDMEQDTGALEDWVADFLAEVYRPIIIRGARLSACGTAGIAVYPDHGATAEQLFAHSDEAMYLAKRRGRRVETYSPALAEELLAREQRMRDLQEAIRNDAIDLDFQPQVDMTTKTISGFEALARWQHPKLGRLSPAYFIPMAEETGLIVPFGGHVLLKACQKAKRLEQISGRAISIAVNISAHQLSGNVILDQVNDALAKSGLAPASLELELTETALADLNMAVPIMKELHSMGVRTALDDFGTGYSNLSALAAMPLDKLKIDRSIIQNIPGNTAAAAIASALIAMAQKLDIQVLAEGVETAEQLAFLAENRCDFAQGYLLGRPLGFDAAVQRLLDDDPDIIKSDGFDAKAISEN